MKRKSALPTMLPTLPTMNLTTLTKFISAVNKNYSIFNTKDRKLWYTFGESYEKISVEEIVPKN